MRSNISDLSSHDEFVVPFKDYTHDGDEIYLIEDDNVVVEEEEEEFLSRNDGSENKKTNPIIMIIVVIDSRLY